MHRPVLKRLAWVLVAAAVLCGAVMINACISGEGPRESFTIAWNYDTSGYMETCGCSSHQYGGLARRATLVNELRSKAPVLALEGAHVVGDKGDFQLFKGEMIVRILSTMGYHGLMLGIREAQHGKEGIAKLKAGAQFPLFSANLLGDGKPAAEPAIKVTLGGNELYITGVSQPELINFDLPDGMSFDEPYAALERVLAHRPPGADMTIVCLEGETSWIEETMRRYRDKAELFLTGDRSVAAAELEFTADPPRINNRDNGRFMSVVTVDPAAEGYSIAGQNIPLADTLVDEPAVKDILVKDYKSQLKERFFGDMKEQLGKLYMPPDSCKHCHEKEYEIYMRSGHALAMKTLVDKNELYNPDCMKCHVSYDSGQDQLVSMDCTTCHANITEDHVWDANMEPEKIKRPDPPVTTYTYGWCVRCHDEHNSARFKDHWPQMVRHIAHGGDLGPALEAAKQMGIDYNAEPPGH